MLFKVLIAGALCAVSAAGSALAAPDGERAARLAQSLCPVLQPGDLVFKGASTAIWTQLAAGWSDATDRRWGHVGLVVTVDTQGEGRPDASPDAGGCDAGIVHADTGTGNPGQPPGPGEEIGAVRDVPLEAFLGDVDHVGVFRLALDADQRARMLAWARGEAERRTPFDRGYNLDSENNLYCTELIWRAMSKGLGADAVPQKSHRMGRTYIALSDLSRHPLAEELVDLDVSDCPPGSDCEQ